MSVKGLVKPGYRISKDAANDYARWYTARKCKVLTENDIIRAAKERNCILHKHFFSKSATHRFVRLGMWKFANDLLNGVRVLVVVTDKTGKEFTKECVSTSILKEDKTVLPLSAEARESISAGNRIHIPVDMALNDNEVAKAVVRRAYEDFMKWKRIYEAVLSQFGAELRPSIIAIEQKLQDTIASTPA